MLALSILVFGCLEDITNRPTHTEHFGAADDHGFRCIKHLANLARLNWMRE